MTLLEHPLLLWLRLPRFLVKDPAAYIQNVSERSSLKPFFLIFAITAAPISYLLIRYVARDVVFNMPVDMVLSIVTFGLGVFLHVLLVDMVCDFKIKKKRMVTTLNVMLGVSSWFNGISALFFVSGYLFFRHDMFWVSVLTLLTFWSQWVVEAVLLRHIYSVHFLLIFLLEVVSRVLTSVVALAAISVVTGMWHRWVELLQ